MSVLIMHRQAEPARRFGNAAAARRWLRTKHCLVPAGLLPPGTRIDEGTLAKDLPADTLVCAEMHWTLERHELRFE